MQLQFNEYNFVYPHNLENAKKHAMANRIFKIVKMEDQQKCHCCDRLIGSQGEFRYFCYNPRELLFLGPGIPLYFLFLRQSFYLILCQLLIFGIYSLVTNFQGGVCKSEPKSCSDNVANKFSIINNVQNTTQLIVLNYLILACIFVYFLILQLIRRQSSKFESNSHEYIDLPSSYSIMLRRLPHHYTQFDILEMIEKKRQMLTPFEKAITNNLAVQKIILSYSLRQIKQVKNENIKNFKKLTKEHKPFTPIQMPGPGRVAPLAIVTFQVQCSKQYFLHKLSTCDKILKCFWSVYLPYSQNTVRETNVSVQTAPQPDDIHWQNCGVSYKGNVTRRLAGKCFIFLVLVCAAATQVALKYIQGLFINTKLSQFISICFSLGVTLLNVILQYALQFIISKQRLQTVTEQSISLASTISLLQFLNSGLVVMLSNLIINTSNYNLDGLSENVLTFMIINMFLPHLTLLFLDGVKPMKWYQRWRINKSQNIYTQKQVNQAYEGSNVHIALRCVYVIKTVWLTMFYAPFIPFVIPISMVGIFLYYHLEKYMYMRHYKVPNMISQQLTKQMLDLLDYSPFLLSSGNFLVYLYLWYFQISKIPKKFLIPIIISSLVSFVYIFVPTGSINEAIFRFKVRQRYKPPYSEVNANFNTDYDIANPVYHQINKKKRNNNFFKPLGQIGNLYNSLHQNKENLIQNRLQERVNNNMVEMMSIQGRLLENQINPFNAYVSQKREPIDKKDPKKDQCQKPNQQQINIRVSSPSRQDLSLNQNYAGSLPVIMENSFLYPNFKVRGNGNTSMSQQGNRVNLDISGLLGLISPGNDTSF